ncbi:hypothetical protein CK203_012782 [Vitis vinifera]|uniref:Uncharacterized protein n=1 Tax=Vitis vinifera TaxID=29760 RepID=A0A438KMV3_VITVI|nr:hypothetical protein CK203_012782 [Vitis vinifera]
MGMVENIDDLALEFGSKVGSLPSPYLGLPLGAPFKFMAAWVRVEKRLVRLSLKHIQRDFLWGVGCMGKKKWGGVLGKWGKAMVLALESHQEGLEPCE